jgi:hypothetical protein
MRFSLAYATGLVVVWFSLAGAIAAAAETYELRDVKDSADLSKVRAQIEVSGALRVKADQEEKQLGLNVSAVIQYDEHRLPANLDGRGWLRQYSQADATIRIDNGEHHPKLAANRRLLAVYVTADKARIFRPTGPMTRDELELIDIPGNSAVLPLLLPGKSVEVGAKWAVPADTLAMLLGIDSASSTDVQCTLKEVKADKLAKIELSGNVDGSAGGVATEIAVKGNFDYDLTARRVSRLDLSINENRAIGQVGPGLKVWCHVQLTAERLEQSQVLTDDRLIRAARLPESTALLLSCESPADGYHFLHSRQWHVVDQRQNVTALRLIDRGELVAQCNIAPAKTEAASASGNGGDPVDVGKLEPAKAMTLEAYVQAVQKTLDKRFKRLVSSNETTTKNGLKAFVVVTEGEAQEVPIRWVHYLLTHSSGKQVGLVFTMAPKQAELFGSAAEELVNTFRIGPAAGAPAKSTSSPTAKARPVPATKPPPAGAAKLPERKPRVAR